MSIGMACTVDIIQEDPKEDEITTNFPRTETQYSHMVHVVCVDCIGSPCDPKEPDGFASTTR